MSKNCDCLVAVFGKKHRKSECFFYLTEHKRNKKVLEILTPPSSIMDNLTFSNLNSTITVIKSLFIVSIFRY